MTFTDEQNAALSVINQVGGCLSLLGSSFIIICYLKFVNLRSFAFKLVCYMAIATFFLSIAAIIGNNHSHTICVVQAIIMSYFETSALIWAFLIAFVLHQAFLNLKETFQARMIDTYRNHFLLAGWGYPLLFTILPMTTNSYGEAGGWCWIIDDNPIDIVWRFLQFYIPLWMIMIYCMWVYIRVAREFQRQAQELELEENAPTGSKKTPVGQRLKLYPLVLVICYFWASINRVYQLFSGGQTVFFLSVLQSVFSSPLGLANAIVYGLTGQIRSAVKRELCGTADLEEV